MKADQSDQHKLLTLADEDVALTQFAHRRRTMPEAAALEVAADTERDASADVVRAETEVSDLQREVARLEKEVEVVRARTAKDQGLLDSGSVSAKQMTDLQHEMTSLKRRQSELEDAELELMEQVETAEATLAAARETLAAAEVNTGRAEQLRDDALADVVDGTANHESRRASAAAAIPPPLLALYDRIRAQTGTSGAALFQARQCSGCRIEFNGRDLAAVRNADPDEVVRCENCGRILVRTDESGL